MRKIYLLFLAILFTGLLAAQPLLAQTKTNSIYLELGGPGGIYSLNYDIRFQNSIEGWGARIGVSYFALDGESLFTIPVQINYLMGKDGNYFELGAGVTYGYRDDDYPHAGCSCVIPQDAFNHHVFYGSITIGYRYQPPNGGFLFRIGLSPLFNKETFQLFYPYLSAGFSFWCFLSAVFLKMINLWLDRFKALLLKQIQVFNFVIFLSILSSDV